ELVAAGLQVRRQQAAHGLFGGALVRAVVVGQVEVGDAAVERAPHDGALRVEGAVGAEVVPQAYGHGGQLQAGGAAAAVRHRVVGGVPVVGGTVHVGVSRVGDHAPSVRRKPRARHGPGPCGR